MAKTAEQHVTRIQVIMQLLINNRIPAFCIYQWDCSVKCFRSSPRLENPTLPD